MAVVKKHRETIDGNAYITETLPATEGLELIGALGGLLDVQAGKLLMAIEGEGEARALLEETAVVAALIGSALKAAQAAGGLAPLAKQILHRTVCENMKVGDVVTTAVEGNVIANFDDHFAGRYLHLGKLCVWVVRMSLGLP